MSPRRRVVVTGMHGISPIGDGWPAVRTALLEGRSGVAIVPEWERIDGLRTRLGAPVPGFQAPPDWPRKKTRGMGRVALLAAAAVEGALSNAGLRNEALVRDGTLGLAFGSTSGTPEAMVEYARAFGVERSTKGASPTDYLRLMSHTCAANVALLFEIRGRVVPTCSACTSGSQAIGVAYEAVAFGRQRVMVAGGAEELHAIEASVFDMLLATSTKTLTSTRTPRPFDAARDGLVVGEGAGALVLEDLELARERGAVILAEVLGFGTCCDGTHLTQPDSAGMQRAMELALADAGLAAADVGYVNAHATATELGDVAESAATHRVFGERVPVSSLKGHLGHTLGACGALEAWIALEAVREGFLPPTLNLDDVDPRCAPLDYVRGAPRTADVEIVMSNNFAFGGINTSLVFRRWRG